jgi:hypothetical protein
MFGFDFGIEIVDKDGNLLDGISGPNLQTANGPVTILGGLISGNVLAPEQAGMTRGNAYDRSGNGGDGSFWTGNFGSSTFEIDTNGDILRTYANAGEVTYGLGIDPTSGGRLMWVNSGPDATGALELAEYDLTSGTLTGQTMRSIDGIQGGLDIVPGSLGRGGLAGGYDVLHLQQAGPDVLRIRRLHMDVAGEGIPPAPVTRLGTLEPDLLVSTRDERWLPRNDWGLLQYDHSIGCAQISGEPGLNIYLDIGRNPGDGMGNGGLNGTPAIVFANIGPDAAIGVDASSNALNLRELAHLQPLLTAPQPVFAVRSRGMVLSNDPLTPELSEWRIPLEINQPFQGLFECVRFQGAWIDQRVPFLPLAFTNQSRLCRGPTFGSICGTYAQAKGSNTFNADTSEGFFQVFNDETDPNLSIVHLTFDLDFGAHPSSRTQNLIDNFFRWDTNNPDMADVFEGGNSVLSGCLGTYRNGSEVSNGLIFSGTPQQNLMPCDPGAMQGWIGSIDGPSAYGSSDGDWLKLDFHFAPDTFLNGAKFEFDCDTDGGTGVNGSAMAGVLVTVEFKNGSISTGEFFQDGRVPLLSWAQL